MLLRSQTICPASRELAQPVGEGPPIATFKDLKNATNGHLDAYNAVTAAVAEPPSGVLPGEQNSDFAPAIDDDGRVIVFLSNRVTANNPAGRPRLWIVASDGTGLTEVASTGVPHPFPFSSDSSPSLSADGTRLAWVSDRNGTSDIYSARLIFVGSGFALQGFEQRTNTAADDIQAQISADGRYIAFASDADFVTPADTLHDYEIFRITTFSTGDTVSPIEQASGQITTDTSDAFAGLDALYASDRRPSISGNGDVVAWINYLGKPFAITGISNFQGSPDAIGVATFGPSGSIRYWQPTPTEGLTFGVPKTFMRVSRDGTRIVHHDLASFGLGTSFYSSTAIDGTGTVTSPIGPDGSQSLVGMAMSPDGATVMEYQSEGFGLGGTFTNIVKRPFGDRAAATILASYGSFIFAGCGLLELGGIVTSVDVEHPACRGALSGNGNVAVFVGSSTPVAETEPRKKDLWIYEAGQVRQLTSL
jgi:hypothetical protein